MHCSASRITRVIPSLSFSDAFDMMKVIGGEIFAQEMYEMWMSKGGAKKIEVSEEAAA